MLILPFYYKNKKICPATALKEYLKRTSDIRGNIEHLFISITRPFKAVREQTLSRWVKETLKNSGIHTNVFTAHSTRHASTSAAKRSGVSIDTLRKTAS